MTHDSIDFEADLLSAVILTRVPGDGCEFPALFPLLFKGWTL
jgi:hypothetical protein